MAEAKNQYELLEARLEEADRMLKLAKWRISSAEENLSRLEMVTQLAKGIVEYGSSMLASTSIKTDVDWISALVSEGLDQDTILRVWQTKDQESFEIKDSKNT